MINNHNNNNEYSFGIEDKHSDETRIDPIINPDTDNNDVFSEEYKDLSKKASFKEVKYVRQ